MAVSLVAHDSNGYGVAVSCTASRPYSDTLSLQFEISQPQVEDILGLGAGSEIGQRTDGLWKRTCVEAFIRCSDPADASPPGNKPYYEVNVEPPKPGARWQCYRFNSYRTASTPAEPVGVGVNEVSARWAGGNSDARRWTLECVINLGSEAAGWPAWEVYPTAIIQGVHRTDSVNSCYEAFWALAHADGKPDFHKMVASSAIVLQAPPGVTLSFLRGDELHVDVSAGDTVGTLVQKAAAALNKAPVRLSLSCGERVLDLADSASDLTGLTVNVTVQRIDEKSLIALFKVMDTKGDFRIDANELGVSLTSAGIQITDPAFIVFDGDEEVTGTLNYGEFVHIIQNQKLGPYCGVDANGDPKDWSWDEIREKLFALVK